MEGFGWIMTIIIGALAGWIAEKVMKFDTGLLMNIVLGIAGAIVGNFLLGLLGLGLSNAEIGRRLYLSSATVKDYVSAVLAKLDVSNRVQAAVVAQEAGLLPLDRGRG